jgi:SagB-type dehydrogenase family enzyme
MREDTGCNLKKSIKMNDPRVSTVLAYHKRSKHALDHYAAGPGTLDWNAQPNAFRDWIGTQQIALPREVVVADITWDELSNERPPVPLNISNIGSLLRLCVGLTAWKEYAGSRWSLRANPSSGNLHPTETWIITGNVDGLEDGLYHYQNFYHALERRAWGSTTQSKGLWLGLSSIHWREAWKYGERAFRYCQLDLGHALAAVSYAAALHGWKTRLVNLNSTEVAHCLGLDRAEDFTGVEQEEPEVIVAFEAETEIVPSVWQQWAGKPSLLDANPLYEWPVIEEVANATRGTPPTSDFIPDFTFDPSSSRRRGSSKTNTPRSGQSQETDLLRRNILSDWIPASEGKTDIGAAQVIHKRRSAQAFDGQSVMPSAVFKQLLNSLLPGGSPVWNLWPHTPRVHPVLMVHRVEGFAPGLYVMPRSDLAKGALKNSFRETFTWLPVEQDPSLFQLILARTGKTARTLSCHQDIATQSAVTFMMLAEFEESIAVNAEAYRHLHWEAGMLGHVLTLEAEAAGWRGTGIGCFFDDADHEVLGIKDNNFQVIYHYAIGMALDDPRILTLPAYD